MEIGGLHNKVNDPKVAQLIDNILDAVLALKPALRIRIPLGAFQFLS